MSEDAATEAQAWFTACEEALTALRYALQWELPEAGWDEVTSAISDIAQAVAAHDADLLIQATGNLELCGPLRVEIRQGGNDSRGPAPVKVQEPAAKTIKTLEDSKGH